MSGFWEGMEGRAQTVLDSPSVYNIANWLSMGLLDLGKGAVNPEKPLSLEQCPLFLGFFLDVVRCGYALCRPTMNVW